MTNSGFDVWHVQDIQNTLNAILQAGVRSVRDTDDPLSRAYLKGFTVAILSALSAFGVDAPGGQVIEGRWGVTELPLLLRE